MYQSDYILRQIEMLGTLLKRMLDAMREGRTDEPLEMIEEVFEEVAGAGPDLIDALPVEGLLAMLSAGGQLDEGRTALLGMLLVHRAEALVSAGRPDEAEEQRARGYALLEALPDDMDPAVLDALLALRAEFDHGPADGA